MEIGLASFIVKPRPLEGLPDAHLGETMETGDDLRQCSQSPASLVQAEGAGRLSEIGLDLSGIRSYPSTSPWPNGQSAYTLLPEPLSPGAYTRRTYPQEIGDFATRLATAEIPKSSGLDAKVWLIGLTHHTLEVLPVLFTQLQHDSLPPRQPSCNGSVSQGI